MFAISLSPNLISTESRRPIQNLEAGRSNVPGVNPESGLAASIVWKIDFLLLQERT
jgi:hypothetical protein